MGDRVRMALPARLIDDPEPRRDLDAEVDYPSSDGLALHGTNRHALAVHLAVEALRRHYVKNRKVFVGDGIALYYVEGDNDTRLVPDVMVVRGIERRPLRRSYKTWEEPVPQFVLEVASLSTVDRDLGFKMEQYRRLGVREYWQLDQEGGLLPRELMGHRLRRGRYEELAPSGRVGLAREYHSDVLGLLLRTAIYDDGLTVVFRDPRTGKDVLVGEEVVKAVSALEERAEAAEGRAEAAEGRAEAAERGRQEEAEARSRAEARAQAAERRIREEAEASEDLVAELRARLRALGDDIPE